MLQKNLLSDLLLYQKLKAWWELTSSKIIAYISAVALILGLVLDVCDLSVGFFSWDLWGLCPCQEECDPPPPLDDDPIKLARKLFGNNLTDLQAKIRPTFPLKIGQEISLQVTNNSGKDGYFLVFSIDSKEQLFSFVSEISKRLELQYIPAYLQVNKGETIIIPQPNVPDDPLAGIRVSGNIGQELLVVILVDKLPSKLLGILMLDSEIQPTEILTNLHKKLESPVEDEMGGTYSIQWSSQVIDYEIISSQTK